MTTIYHVEPPAVVASILSDAWYYEPLPFSPERRTRPAQMVSTAMQKRVRGELLLASQESRLISHRLHRQQRYVNGVQGKVNPQLKRTGKLRSSSAYIANLNQLPENACTNTDTHTRSKRR